MPPRFKWGDGEVYLPYAQQRLIAGLFGLFSILALMTAQNYVVVVASFVLQTDFDDAAG
jgi:hypothetical protein